jgi:hypothetical protein
MARQAGSAAALAPVVRAMSARNDIVFTCAAAATARASFEAVGITPDVELPLEPSVDWLAAWLEQREISGVLTGTSFEPGLDGRFWLAAGMVGIPAVALLDHWCNYVERFSDRARFDRLPDALAVMDDVAASALRAAGFPPERIHTTGHPYLDEITPVTADERSVARRALGVNDARHVITFASEPITPAAQLDLGYTAIEALEAVRFAIAGVAPDSLLVIRLHPREREVAAPAGQPETIVARKGAPREAIAASDVMTGMRSMLLLEAALAGTPTLSVRPNGGPDQYLDAHASLIISACDTGVLPSILRHVLDAAPSTSEVATRSSGEASRHVIRLLDIHGGTRMPRSAVRSRSSLLLGSQ